MQVYHSYWWSWTRASQLWTRARARTCDEVVNRLCNLGYASNRVSDTITHVNTLHSINGAVNILQWNLRIQDLYASILSTLPRLYCSWLGLNWIVQERAYEVQVEPIESTREEHPRIHRPWTGSSQRHQAWWEPVIRHKNMQLRHSPKP